MEPPTSGPLGWGGYRERRWSSLRQDWSELLDEPHLRALLMNSRWEPVGFGGVGLIIVSLLAWRLVHLGIPVLVTGIVIGFVVTWIPIVSRHRLAARFRLDIQAAGFALGDDSLPLSSADRFRTWCDSQRLPITVLAGRSAD